MSEIAGTMLTLFGVVAALTMVVSYALEGRHRRWIAVFAVGCAATSIYGVLTQAWIFAVLETVWALIALHRYRQAHESGLGASS